MTSPINDQLDAIFGIPKDGSNIKDEPSDESQETSYAEVIVANENVSFEQKAQTVRDSLAKDAPPVSVVYTSKAEENLNVKPQQPVAAVEPAKSVEDKFEEILTKSIRNEIIVPKEVQPVVQEPRDAHKDSEHEEEEKVTVSTGPSVVFNHKVNENGWYLTPPSPMFTHFYTEKASLIMNIMRNGRPIEIDKLNEELKISNVSTKVELTDMTGMAQKLDVIQDLLDRVVQIKIQATSQCIASKRGVELLRGVLAKVIYEKPAARQDGVIYDHMKDIEMYASRVESLEQSAKDVYHNLLESKEILSRKISIALELIKEQNRMDAMENKFNGLSDGVKKSVLQASSTPPNRLANEGYDRLEVQEAVKLAETKPKEPPKKSGNLSWLD